MTNDGPLLPEGMWLERAPHVRRRRRRRHRRFKRLRSLGARVVPARVRRWFDDNPALGTIVGVLLLLLLVILFWLLWLWLHLNQTPEFDLDLGENRPPFVGGENILLVGLDCDEAAAAGDTLRTCAGTADGFALEDITTMRAEEFASTGVRSDVIMVLHVSEDGSRAQVISIPRDSYVAVEGHGRTKINAAFSYGGPNLLGRTIEQNFGIHLTHIAITEFDGFRGITEALGGVQVYVPEAISDPHCNCVTWERGWQTIEGDRALAYVRTRYGLARGDFDRVQRHQNFLRAVVNRTRDMSVLANPLKVTRLVDEITGHIALDSEFSDSEVIKLTYSALKMSLRDISFATVPFKGSAMVGDQSVVLLEEKQARRMFDAVARDRFLAWAGDNKVETLPPENAVK